jgi:hypothetical protein
VGGDGVGLGGEGEEEADLRGGVCGAQAGPAKVSTFDLI